MAHHPVTTAYSLETLERYSLLYRIGADVRQADAVEAATHHAPRHFRAGVSAGISRLQHGEQYLGVLSAPASSDQLLLQDASGQVSPSATGPQVGRAIGSGVAGDEVEFIYEPASGSGGGVTAGEVATQITQAENSRTIIQPVGTGSNTLVTVGQWASPTISDQATVIYEDGSDNVVRTEYQTFNGSVWEIDRVLVTATPALPLRVQYGDGVTTEYVIPHTMNTDTFTVYVERTATGVEVNPTIVDRTATTVVIRHAFAPSLNEFTAVLEVG